MVDLEIPPVVEGEADGGVDAVPQIKVDRWALATASNRAAFTRLPWTTTTALP